MLDENQITRMITHLEWIRSRPQMFMAQEVPPISNFMYGFLTACQVFEVEFHRDYGEIYKAVLISRGWKLGSYPLWEQLTDAEAGNEEITHEILEVHIEVWRRVLATLSQP